VAVGPRLRQSDPVDRRYVGEALRNGELSVVLTGHSDRWKKASPEAVMRALE
jgi:hypothetical protein